MHSVYTQPSEDNSACQCEEIASLSYIISMAPLVYNILSFHFFFLIELKYFFISIYLQP